MLVASFLFSFDGDFSPAILIGICFVIFAGSIFLFRRFFGFDRILLSAFVLIGFLLGIFAYSLSFPSAQSVAHLTGDSVRVEGVVVHAGPSSSGQKLTLSQLWIDDVSAKDRIVMYVPAFPDWSYGDRIVSRCTLEAPESFDGFAYDRYLAARNVYATCFVRSAPVKIAAGEGGAIKGSLMTAREAIISHMDQTFGEPHASLLAGLILGEQRFREEWEEAFVATGTTHIVAASGYNVAVVTMILSVFLFSVGVKRGQAFTLLVVGIVVYVFLAGAEPPVVRAGIMGMLILLSHQSGRKTSMLNILLLTAVVMLVVNPRLLRDDVGFQLSMLSTVALIYLAPALEKKFSFIPKGFGLRESFTATIAATLITLPIVFLSFQQLSLISPLTNLLVLPVIPYAMAFGALATAVSFLAPTAIASVFAGPAWALLSLVLVITSTMAEIPFAHIQIAPTLLYPLAGASVMIIYFVWKHSLSSGRVH